MSLVVLSSLQPVRLRIRQFSFKIRDDYPMFLGENIPLRGEHLNLGMELGMSPPLLTKFDDGRIGLMASLGLELDGDRTAHPEGIFERIAILADGLFTVPLQEDIEDALVEHLVHNCFMMVYGAIRGHLNILTAVVPGSFIVLPGIDLMGVLRQTDAGSAGNLGRIKAALLGALKSEIDTPVVRPKEKSKKSKGQASKP